MHHLMFTVCSVNFIIRMTMICRFNCLTKDVILYQNIEVCFQIVLSKKLEDLIEFIVTCCTVHNISIPRKEIFCCC